ncbi:MAG: hypothetical protein ACLTGI_01130 [Hoylesella buccalis]
MTILRKNWLSLLVFSVIGGAYLAFGLTNAMHTMGNSLPTGKLVTFGLLNVLLLCASVWYMARTTTLLNENGFACNLKRIAKLQLAYVVVMGVISLLLTAATLSISDGQKPAPAAVGTAGMGLQAWSLSGGLAHHSHRHGTLCLFLHEIHSGERGQIQKRMCWEVTEQDCAALGSSFPPFFLYGIVIFFLTLILLMPVYILFMASTLSQMGVQNGDPNTLPTYFPLLTYGTCILIYFICAAFLTVGIYVNYYVYGAIEARRQAQSNRKAIQTEAAEASNRDGALTNKDDDTNKIRFVLKTNRLIFSQRKPFSPSSNCIEFGSQ